MRDPNRRKARLLADQFTREAQHLASDRSQEEQQCLRALVRASALCTNRSASLGDEARRALAGLIGSRERQSL